jgi:hypothetical protein
MVAGDVLWCSLRCGAVIVGSPSQQRFDITWSFDQHKASDQGNHVPYRSNTIKETTPWREETGYTNEVAKHSRESSERIRATILE